MDLGYKPWVECAVVPEMNVNNLRFESLMCAGSGAIAAVISHIGCVAVVLFAGASSISVGLLNDVMLFLSPMIAVGVTVVADYSRRSPFSWGRVAAAAGVAIILAVGVNAVGGHALHIGKTRLATADITAQWLKSLDPKTQDAYAREADLYGLSLDRYAQIQIYLMSLDDQGRQQLASLAEVSGQSVVMQVNGICVNQPVRVLPRR